MKTRQETVEEMEARVREMVVEEVSRELEESRDSQLRLR